MSMMNGATTSFVLSRLGWGVFSVFAITYVLFQKHLLPIEVSKFVSKILFLPTFPITLINRIGQYWTKVDDTLYLGCAPMAVLQVPRMIYKEGVRGVVNMCYEYKGPKAQYEQLGIKQLHLPSCDHFEPSLDYMKEAISFISMHKKRGEKVYVHCKAGHGRAASIALCWMIHENPDMSAKDLNILLKSKRKVRGTLFDQPNVKAYLKSLRS